MIPDFRVAVDHHGSVVGCGALPVLSPGLGEINALAIRDDYQGLGIGSNLVRSLIMEGIERGFREILAITYQTGFFTRLEFTPTERTRFIDKIRREALECPELETCPEPALHFSVAFAGAQE